MTENPFLKLFDLSTSGRGALAFDMNQSASEDPFINTDFYALSQSCKSLEHHETTPLYHGTPAKEKVRCGKGRRIRVLWCG